MDKLTELLHKNFEEYKENLLRQDRKTIFEKSYETAIKCEMAEYCDFDNLLSYCSYKELVKMDNPLDFLYEEYLKSDNANIINELAVVFKEL